MEKFSLSERYKLELHWEEAIYEQDGICKLKNAVFKGPALSIAQKIRDNDAIMVDFFVQYALVVDSVYVAKLSWGQAIYNKDGSVSLKDAFLKHDTQLNRAPKLKNTDYLIIDTSNHEAVIHKYHLVYKTYVVNSDSVLYKFWG